MLTIKDPTLKRLLLEHLIEQLDEGALPQLIAQGCDPELLELLRHRAALDIVRAGKHESLQMTVTFNSRDVISSFTRLDAIKRDAELQEYLLINGASNEMLMQLFRIQKRRAIQLRSLLLPDEKSVVGRPPMPPEGDRPVIHNTWAKLCRAHPDESLAWRIRRLHEAHPQWLIHALWATLHEFDNDDASVASSRRQRSR
jgi:hypothetical protein